MKGCKILFIYVFERAFTHAAMFNRLEEFVRHHWESFGDVAPAEKEKAVDLAKFGGWKIVKSALF